MRTKFFIETLVSVALGLIIGLFILMISNKNAQQIDVTKNGRFTLSEQSMKAVENLKAPVQVYAFVDASGKKKAEDLLNRYRRKHPEKVSYELIDPYKRPRLAQKYDIRQAGSLVIETPGPDGKTPRVEKAQAITEQEMTNALMRMTRVRESKVYVLTGHGERAIDGKGGDGLGAIAQDLSKEGMTLEALNLVKDKLPETAKILMIAGPRRPLLEGEEKAIRDFLNKNGSVFLLIDPDTPDSYAKLLNEFGFDSPPQVVIDEASQLVGAEPIFAVGYTYNVVQPITQEFKQNAVFRLARPVNAAKTPPANATLTWLCKTAPTAFTISAEQMGKEVKIDPSKQNHVEITLAVAGEYPKGPAPTPTPGAEPSARPEARIVVVGDSDFVSNALFRQAPGNRDFALNILNWLNQSENQISIRPVDAETQPLRLTQSELSRMMLIYILAVPFLVGAMGVFLTYRRR